MSDLIQPVQHEASFDREPPAGATFAFLFTDIEGSSARWERHPAAMRLALARHDIAIGAAVAASRGRVFKSTGDGLCAVFPEARLAIAAALEAQCRLGAEDFSAVTGIAARMAVHAGPAEARDGDYFGATLNRAARLVAIGHGGQILLSGIAANLVDPADLPADAALLPLGEHRLRDLVSPEAVHQLIHPRLRADFPPLRALEARLNNLPRQSSALIGRKAELAAVTDLATRHRLVTLLGTGGIGKTRLAVQAGAELLHRFPDGVLFIELAPLTEAAQIGVAVAPLLGITASGDRPTIETLAGRLRRKTLLLILDNCEHLVAPAAAFAEALLCQTETVSILATSREALGAGGEQCFALHGLAVPPETARLAAAEALRFGAIRLFAERAGRAVAGFTLDDAAAPSVAAICRRLDGMALALELAAPWLRMLSPAELLARLDDRFALLTSRHRAALPRQQTLRALIGWSHDLLSAAEQAAFARLAVFSGGFSIAAATEVVAGGLVAPEAVFDLVAALLDKSMVSVLPGPDRTRYRLLETTRHYALERLAASGEMAATQRRLTLWLIRHFNEAREIWPTTPSDLWTARYTPDLDNLRAALTWAFGPEGDIPLALELVSQTARFRPELAIQRDHRRWLSEAVAHLGPDTPKPVAARIWYDLSFSFAGGTFGDRRRLEPALRALDLYREIGEAEDIALAATRVAYSLARPGDTGEAQPYLDAVEAALPAFPVTKLRAGLLNNLAIIANFAGRLDRAMVLFEQALAISQRYRDPDCIQSSGTNLAELLFKRGEFADAAARAGEVARSCRESGNLFNLSHVLGNLAGYTLMLGDTDAARAAVREALPLLADFGFDVYFADCVQGAALVAAQAGDGAAASRLAGYSGQFYAVNEMEREPTEQAVFDALTALLDQAERAGHLPERARLMADGAALIPEAAMRIALMV